MATVSVMFLLLVVWLKGLSNLIGFKDDLVLSLIVPIAMVSFGVDYAFHALGRYREERAAGRPSRVAVVTGAAGVSGALILATASDSVAFLANTTAGIESIVQFGIGAAIALFGAYVLLGVVSPILVGWIEGAVPPPTPGVAFGRAARSGSGRCCDDGDGISVAPRIRAAMAWSGAQRHNCVGDAGRARMVAVAT